MYAIKWIYEVQGAVGDWNGKGPLEWQKGDCMNRLSMWVGVFLLVGTFGCISSRPDWPEIKVEQQEWISPTGRKGVQLLTEHFDIRVTSPDEKLRAYLGPFAETAFSAYSELMPTNENYERLVVYLFEVRPEWAAFTRMAFPARSQAYLHIHYGGYTDSASATCVMFDLGRDHTLSLMAHEGWHQYLAAYFTEPMPPWLNEGIATQFEGFDLDGDRPIFKSRENYGRRNHLRSAMSQEDGLIPLAELLRIHAGHAVTQKTKQPSLTYYAQVWSLVLMLREGYDGRYADRFAQLLADIGGNHITEDLDTFMDEYREYVGYLLR